MVVELDRKDLAILLDGTEVPLEMEDELLGKRLVRKIINRFGI